MYVTGVMVYSRNHLPYLGLFCVHARVCVLFVLQLLTKEPVESGSTDTYGDFDYQVSVSLKFAKTC